MTRIEPKDMNKIDLESFNKMMLWFFKRYDIEPVRNSDVWMSQNIQDRFSVHVNKSIMGYNESNSSSQNVESINWFVENVFVDMGFLNVQINAWFYPDIQAKLEKILLDILKKTYYRIPTSWVEEDWKSDLE